MKNCCVILFSLFYLFSCSSGNDGGDRKPTASHKISKLDVFPLDRGLTWTYSDSSTAVSITRYVDIGDYETAEMQHPNGDREYFHTNGNELYLLGLDVKAYAGSASGSSEYSAALRFADSPIKLYSKEWVPYLSHEVSASGTADIQPTIGARKVDYTGWVTPYGSETVYLANGTYTAEHLLANLSFSVNISNQTINIPIVTELWISKDIGIVKRRDNGVSIDLVDKILTNESMSVTRYEGSTLLYPAVITKTLPKFDDFYNLQVETAYSAGADPWLSVSIDPATETLNAFVYKLALPIGSYSAVVTLSEASSNKKYILEVTHNVVPPTLEAVNSSQIDLQNIISINDLTQVMNLSILGAIKSWSVNSFPSWLSVVDSSPDSSKPQLTLSINPDSVRANNLTSLSGTIVLDVTSDSGDMYSAQLPVLLKISTNWYSSTQLQLTDFAGGATTLPASELTFIGVPIPGSKFSATISYDGNISNWLSTQVNPTSGMLEYKVTANDLPIGTYTATITLDNGGGISISYRIYYKITAPVLVVPSKLTNNLQTLSSLNDLVTEIPLEFLGNINSWSIDSFPAWLNVEDISPSYAEPRIRITVNPSQLISLGMGYATGNIVFSYSSNYIAPQSTSMVIDTWISDSWFVTNPVINNFVSGKPLNSAATELSFLGVPLTGDITFDIGYNNSITPWLSVTKNIVTGNYELSITTSELPPGTYSASIVAHTSTGADIPLEVTYTLEAPKLVGPSNVVLSVDQNTTTLDLHSQLQMSHTGELLNWSISSSLPWLLVSQASNALDTGAVANLDIDLTTLSSLDSGTYTGVISVVYSGKYVSATSLDIPVAISILFPQTLSSGPYVFNTGQNSGAILTGVNYLNSVGQSLSIGSNSLSNFQIVDDSEIRITVPSTLAAGEYFLNFSNALNITRNDARVVVKDKPAYVDSVVTIPGGAVNIEFDEERNAFFGVFRDLQLVSPNVLARIQYSAGNWVVNVVNLPSGVLAATLTPDGKELLVHGTDCKMYHVDPDALTWVNPPVSVPCFYTTNGQTGLLHALNDGQVLFGSLDQWPTLWEYPSLQIINYPMLYSPSSIISRSRNRMIFSESSGITGPRSITYYDPKTDVFNYFSVQDPDTYFSPFVYSLSSDSSRFTHFNYIYDYDMNFLGTLDGTTPYPLDNIQASPDGKKAIRYSYDTKSISVYDISGTTGPFPKMNATDYPVPANSVDSVQQIFMTDDNATLFLFGLRYLSTTVGGTRIYEFSMIVQNI